MKKILWIGIVMLSIIGMSSCDYDDSNDIDLINPNDSTQSITKEVKLQS